MKTTRLQKLFGILIATGALGARGLSCGPCPDSVVVTPALPPSSDGGVEDAGDWLADECKRKCPYGTCEIVSIPIEDGRTIPAIECTTSGDCVGGRRPFGQEDTKNAEKENWLARAAWLETVSIAAFRDLRWDLHRLGAPRALQRCASRAKRDEMRHAKHARALAKRANEHIEHGAAPAFRPLSLEELATQNAVEGCVRETFGALIASYQAKFAEDPEVRSIMRRIAADETRHAALAFRVHAWAIQRVSPEARVRIERARAAAAQEIAATRTTVLPLSYRKRLGLPANLELENLGRGLVCALAA